MTDNSHHQSHSGSPVISHGRPISNSSGQKKTSSSGLTEKQWIIIACVVVGVLALSGTVFAIVKSNSKPEVVEETPVPKKKKISVPSNIIPLNERPYLNIEPFQGQNGRSLRITLQTMPKEATDAEYLIEYEVGGATAQNASGKNIAVPESENPVGLQGSMGEIDLAKLPSESELLLGTCSAGGACVLNTGLGDGALTVTFSGGAENYAVKSPFAYIENEDGATLLASQDKNFSISHADFKKIKDVVIMQSAGLPAGLELNPVMVSGEKEGATLVQAYQVAFLTTPPTGEFEISLTDASGNPTVTKTIMAYDSQTQTWTDLEAEAKEDVYTVETKLADVYLLVEKGG